MKSPSPWNASPVTQKATSISFFTMRLDHLAQGITPETRDRQREDWRRVAQAWRQWWQQNQDKLGSQVWSPEMLPMPIKESSNAWGTYGGGAGMPYGY